jgi:lysophospholipase L1-like esterase
MSKKHRAPRRRPSAGAVALTTTVALSFALVVGYFLVLWPSGAQPSAASEPSAARHEPAAPKPLRGLQRLVIFGHSMPEGGGASDVAHGYAELTAEATGLQLVNLSEGGTVASTAANTMASSAAVGPHDAVVIHTGMNDIFRRRDDAADLGREAIERLLAGTAEAKHRVLVLECQPDSWLDTPPAVDLQAAYDAWNQMIREEAVAWPGVELLDTCAEWDPKQFTDPPKYHPNDEGHALIAAALTALLTRP